MFERIARVEAPLDLPMTSVAFTVRFETTVRNPIRTVRRRLKAEGRHTHHPKEKLLVARTLLGGGHRYLEATTTSNKKLVILFSVSRLKSEGSHPQ